MLDAAEPETDKTPKTMLILSLLAEQGPKTEYDLYKQLPKLSHGTIHFCLNKLAQEGAITYTQNKHKKAILPNFHRNSNPCCQQSLLANHEIDR